MKNSLKIYFLIFIFFIFSTYNTKNNKESPSVLFSIKNILIEGNVVTDFLDLESDLNFLTDKSLLFLNKEIFLAIIAEHKFISSIELKKKYPHTLIVYLKEKTPIAIQILNKKKFYITNNNEKINFIEHKIYENLPIIFGKNENFDIFYNVLKKNNFRVKEIKAFYYFDIGRWDIILKNKKTIKLPKKNYVDLFPKINFMLDDKNFSKYKIFDLRIKDQLILQ